MPSDRPSPTNDQNPTAGPRLANWSALLALGLLLANAPTPAHAGLVLQAENSTALAGGTGSFDVVLINTGGTFNVSGFSVELATASNSGVTFTSAITATTFAPYLFGTLQFPPLTFATFPTHDFTASDTSMTAPGYVTLSTAGQSYGIEHVTYQVAPGTVAGPVAVTIVMGNNTEILDVNANNLPFTTTNGSITISAVTVPEPASLLAWTTAALLLGAVQACRTVASRTPVVQD